MQTIFKFILLCLSSIATVRSYGYGMFGRGPWMPPFRPFMPSPFMSPFASGFAAGFGSGGAASGMMAAGSSPIPATAGLGLGGLSLGLGGGFGPGFGMRRSGFASPFLPSPMIAPAAVSPFGAGFGAMSPFAAASAFRPAIAPFPPAFAFPFSGFGSRATFGAIPLIPASMAASPALTSPSMGSYASSSRPQFTIMKMGSSSSSSSSSTGSGDPKEVTVAEGISDQDLVAEATGRRKFIYGFKGRKYSVGKPWDVFSKK